jgi:hypothetical protein
MGNVFHILGSSPSAGPDRYGLGVRGKEAACCADSGTGTATGCGTGSRS